MKLPVLLSNPRLSLRSLVLGGAIALALRPAAISAEPSAGATDLVRDGVAKSEIVISATPARMTRFAANELQNYVERISGAKLPIVTEPSGAGIIPIYVGISDGTKKLNLETEGLRHGAYREAAGADWLALLGPDKDFEPIEPWGRNRGDQDRVNQEFDKITKDTFVNNFGRLYTTYFESLGLWEHDDRGTVNAVYGFLRNLGVRWYAPGDIGEVVPKSATISLPAEGNRAVVPDFPLRRITFFHEFLGKPELSLWGLRLGLNAGHDLVGITQFSHGMKFVTGRDEMKEKHPEFYALWNGERATDHKGAGAPSLGAPGLKEKHLAYARSIFDHYQEPMISIDVVDGFGRGISETDAGLDTPERGAAGSMSDYVWGYLDSVARELYKSHPDRMVSALAYSSYGLPPEKIETMSPNIALVEARWRSNFYDEEIRTKHRELREAWLARLPSKMYFTHDYYLYSTPERYGRPTFFPRLIARDLREMKGVSLGDNIEVYDHRPDRKDELKYDEFAIEHLNIYVTSRLWWNADLDLDAVLDEYYTSYYGPVRDEMKAYIEYSEANWPKMRQDAEIIRQSLDLLEKARAAVESGTIYAERVDRIYNHTKNPMETVITNLNRKRNDDLAYRVLVASHSSREPMAKNTIDGILEPEFWPELRIAHLAASAPGLPAAPPTRFQMLRDADFLYLGIHCTEPDMEGIVNTSSTNDDPTILGGDYVSIILETNSHSYYEIAVNPAGAVLEIDHAADGEVKWASGSTIAVHRGEGFWSVEMRIPIAGEGAATLDPLMGIEGSKPREMYPWYFNVARQRVRGDNVQFSAFSPTGEANLNKIEAAARLWGK